MYGVSRRPPRIGTLSVRFTHLILCLEDNEFCLQLRKAVLEQDGDSVIGVSTAKDGKQQKPGVSGLFNAIRNGWKF
jgi:hypothetical protein